MGLPWIRLDTHLADHPKFLELVADKAFQAISAYHFSLGYCGKHGTDGYLPKTALPFVHARIADANKLVEVGLWEVAPGGWAVHHWDEFQLSDEASQKRRERAQKGAAARWEKERKAKIRGV